MPDEVYRTARIRAAEQGRSVSSLVADYLKSLSDSDAEFARLESQQRRIQGQISRFRATERLPRVEAHDRALR